MEAKGPKKTPRGGGGGTASWLPYPTYLYLDFHLLFYDKPKRTQQGNLLGHCPNRLFLWRGFPEFRSSSISFTSSKLDDSLILVQCKNIVQMTRGKGGLQLLFKHQQQPSKMSQRPKSHQVVFLHVLLPPKLVKPNIFLSGIENQEPY